MKKSELRQLIKEELLEINNENKIYEIYFFDDDKLQIKGSEKECKDWIWKHIMSSGEDENWPIDVSEFEN